MKLPRYFFAFFFVSGFCSLVYEVIWLRLSMAKFGVTTPLVSIVLSVFMAGLGLGSWLGGKWMRNAGPSPQTPLRLYGALEFLIGVSAFAAPATIDWGYRALRDAGSGFAWGSGYYYLASGAWVTLALLPWCTCMGATFPFAMAAMRRISAGASEHSFSYLYLANVLGAIAGTVIPAFVLIELFGFYGTLHIASATNVLLALSVFAASSRAVASGKFATGGAQALPKFSSSRTLLWLLFTTGLCSMAMEVIWMRQFTVYLGNVVYAFAAILAMYLAATFTGSLLYRRRMAAGKAKGDAAWIALGLAALLPLLFGDPRLPLPQEQYTLEGFLFGALRAGLGVILFSGLAGFVTPMLVDEWSGGDPDRAGYAYAVNVVGSILGPLVSGFLVLPYVSEHWGLFLVSLPLFLIGFAKAFGPANRKPLLAGCLAASLALLIFTKDYGAKFEHREELRDYAATVIATGEDMDKRLLVNGTGMTVLTPITKVMAHLPLTLLGRPADKALVICFGMGTTFRSMMSWDLHTTAVELIPSVPKLFGYFHSDGPALFRSPLAKIVVDDGRRFLERSGEHFDVIAVDPPPPVSAPTSGLLYSTQIYAIMKAHLKPDGIVQVWYPGGDDVTLASITRAFRQSFPYVRTFESIQGWGIHFLGRMQPFPYPSGAELASRLPAKAASDFVEWQDGETPTQMMDRVLAGEKKPADLMSADPNIIPMSDERPINEYFLLRAIRGE
ncbi:MAG TPA: fused MFS/spermidine synthase [Bryobacteraceae bacterium]|jgi:predicted membrane-bound spermidine synthase|nr:fused MFS/spermidine synthase [Bryobacteraceae bacterium]